MLPYRLITSGKNQRREYFFLNRSPLFQPLPDRNFAWEQKLSYNDFLFKKLPELLTNYFPVEFKDYNNNIQIKVREVECHEPKISEEEAQESSLTWSYNISLVWDISWDCQRMQINLEGGDLKKNIIRWVEDSFKIGKFTLKKKTSQKWEVQEVSGKLKILLEILESSEKNLIIKFYCEQVKRIYFCSLPKINSQGNFIINGHNKLIVLQSVRAPSIYHFSNKDNGFYTEIIPLKGPWINICYSPKNPRNIELKFLNSGLVFNFLDILKTFEVAPELLEKLFSQEELNIENYQETKKLEVGSSLPRFIFNKPNSYFKAGKLGRNKYHRQINIISQIYQQLLAENLYDKSKKIVLKKDSVLEGENLQILQKAFKKNKINSFVIPESSSELYLIKIKSPRDNNKVISIIGVSEDLSEEKPFFDLADLICIVSNHINLYNGLGKIEEEEGKDKLENQVIRRVGDIFYNMFDNNLGGFLQGVDNKYLSYLSQLKKVDLTKIPNIKIFDTSVSKLINTSPLAQLLGNLPLKNICYPQKVSVLGLGGFSSSNTTLATRNINPSYCGRYDLVVTPEGQKVGLVHELTINAKINDFGQVTASYYLVKNGIVTAQLVHLTSEEEWDKYITHCNIKISEKNELLDSKLSAFYQGELVSVPKEKINYIYSSFYHLNSPISVTLPSHTDATRVLMASMSRQAVPLLKNQTPLVSSGIEANLFENSLIIKAKEEGQVDYADKQQIIIKESNNKKRIYKLRDYKKEILSFSLPVVKKGEKVEKGQVISCSNYSDGNELSLGYNLRVAYLCWKGFNYEDAIILNERLVKEDILTSFFVKKYTIVRRNTKYGPEVFTKNISQTETEKKNFSHLDKNGIVKIGSEVKENDILVGKITPQPSQHQETEEELLLKSILGEKAQRFVNSSLYLSKGEKGTVYDIKISTVTKDKNELEILEVYIVHERKVEVGDKLTTRFGSKGVVSKIVPEIDMPVDEEGKTPDIILNPLGIPSRMNIGQLLETVLASAALKLNIKLLIRPFNSPSLEVIKGIIEEAKINNLGSQKFFDGQTGLPFQQNIYNGYIYTYLLNHKSVDKFHVRNTGARSLIYQQPLKGRAQGGGQRVGEMEILALEAQGAAYNVMEMTGPKSDDINKRKLLQNSLLFNDRQIDFHNNPESFNILLQYLRGIGFDLQAFDHRNKEIDFYKYFSKN